MPIQTAIDSISQNQGSPFGFKNRIINGAMIIDQRNAGASGTTVTPGYPVDRWGFNASQSSKFTWQQNAGSVTPPPGFKNYVGLTSSSSYTLTGNDYFQLYQIIEGNNVADLDWGSTTAKPATLSFWVRSSLTGTFGGSIATSKSSVWVMPFTYTISAANTWTYIIVPITAPTATSGPNTDNTAGVFVRFGLGSSGTSAGGTAGVWTNNNYVQPSGTVNVAGTNAATWYLTGVQFEVGNQASSFDWRPFGTELQLCQRYYETSYPMGTRVGAAATAAFIHRNYVSSSNLLIGTSWFKVTKRTTPTVQNYDGSGNPGKVGINDNISDPENQASFTTNVTPHGMAVGTNGYNCNGFRYNFTADAEL